MLNIPIGTLVGQAFETGSPVDMVGLPVGDQYERALRCERDVLIDQGHA